MGGEYILVENGEYTDKWIRVQMIRSAVKNMEQSGTMARKRDGWNGD